MTSSFVIAALGSKALWLMYLWLASSIAASALSNSKGYGEKPGLGTGLLLSVLAPIIWLFIPPKDDLAEWHTRKPWQRRRKPREAEMAEAMSHGTGPSQASGSTVDDSGGAGSRPGESRDAGDQSA